MSGNDQYTKVLLHFSGADASTTFTDSNEGGAAKTWTAAGNAQIDTGIVKTGFGQAGLFDGTGDWITTPDHADFTLGSSEFTADLLFNSADAGATRSLFGQNDSTGAAGFSICALKLSTNMVRFIVSSDGTTQTTVTSTTTYAVAGWHHAALVRTGDILRAFFDGVQEGGDVAFASAVNDSANDFRVGALGELTSSTWIGSIDEFRLSVGVARWTANFTPPAVPYSNNTFIPRCNPFRSFKQRF